LSRKKAVSLSGNGLFLHFNSAFDGIVKSAMNYHGEFEGHKSRDFTKLHFYFNFTLRLLRSRYYDNTDPADIQDKFDRFMQRAVSFCEKRVMTLVYAKLSKAAEILGVDISYV